MRTAEVLIGAGVGLLGGYFGEKLVQAWHRQSLQERIPELIAQYEPMLRVKVAEWGIKRMKTRWGTCNIRAKRIWLNLDLAQYPEPCLEYVVVHEIAPAGTVT
jgi:predicted metal-dependent hydrolase